MHTHAHSPPEVTLDLSVVAPAHNEEENVAGLVGEVEAALRGSGLAYEFILVDDASTDATAVRVLDLLPGRPWLRLVRLGRPVGGGGNGQSAAFREGFARARGRLVAVLDADLQNDPADLPRLLGEMDRSGADLVQGDRSRARADTWMRKQTSRVGRLFRRLILGDTVRDTGCSLRVMRREVALRLPLEFKGMHRFIPATARHLGYTVIEVPVSHRHRHAGQTKYGSMGITKRAIPGLVDCFAVRYMRNRRRWPGEVTEHGPSEGVAAQPQRRAEGAHA